MAPREMMTLFSFLFGLVLGSFLNVCIYRIPRDESIVHPPSTCPACGHRIPFYDNIPLVSYVLLLGKCRACRNPISFRYPVVELITGLLSAALFIRYGPSLHYLLFLAFCSALIVVSFVDIDHRIIPDLISLPGALLGLAFSVLGWIPVSWEDSLIGILLGGGSLLAVGMAFKWLRGKEGMGMGDVKLLAMIGAWMGWSPLPLIVLLSSLTGTLIGGGALLFAGRKLSERIPFGPFIVLGTLICFFFEGDLRYLFYEHLTLGG